MPQQQVPSRTPAAPGPGGSEGPRMQSGGHFFHGRCGHEGHVFATPSSRPHPIHTGRSTLTPEVSPIDTHKSLDAPSCHQMKLGRCFRGHGTVQDDPDTVAPGDNTKTPADASFPGLVEPAPIALNMSATDALASWPSRPLAAALKLP